eukprot:scaffold214037_cov28-Tisochrysis_lutea.AAC.1
MFSSNVEHSSYLSGKQDGRHASEERLALKMFITKHMKHWAPWPSLGQSVQEPGDVARSPEHYELMSNFS